jgi:hypothetical protein
MTTFITDIFGWHQYIGLILVTLGLGYLIFKKYGLWVAALFVYTLISALMVFGKPGFGDFGPLQYKLDRSTATAYGTVLALSIFVAFSTADLINKLWIFLEFLCIIDSVLVIKNNYGILNVGSMDGTFLALMLQPILWRGWKAINLKNKWMTIYAILVVLLPVIAIIRTSGSTIFFIISVEFFALLFAEKKYIWSVVLSVIVLIAGKLHEGSELLNPNGRLEIWKQAMHWWSQYANHWIGTGTGSYLWIGPSTQVDSKMTVLWLWLHNEYLQILFEQGYVGLFLSLAVWFMALYRSRKTPWLFATFAGASVAMCTQFPLRFVATELLFLLILRDSFECKK